VISDEAILAAIPAEGLAFPALAAALGLTQRKLHPLIRRLVERGAVVVETRDGVRWVRHDGQTREELAAEVLRLRRAMARARNTLTRALRRQS
jgi:DNA-binding MarR family transcriptional regulator